MRRVHGTCGWRADAFVREYLRDIKHFIELDQTSAVNVGV